MREIERQRDKETGRTRGQGDRGMISTGVGIFIWKLIWHFVCTLSKFLYICIIESTYLKEKMFSQLTYKQSACPPPASWGGVFLPIYQQVTQLKLTNKHTSIV